MKLLLLLENPLYLRPFVDTVQRLADRGHRIQIAWFGEEPKVRARFEETFATYPAVTFMTASATRSERHREVAMLRRAWNYLRYLESPYRDSTKLRQRAFAKLWRLIREKDTSDGLDPALAWSRAELQRVKGVLEYVEELIPPDPRCEAFLREASPDALLVSPLVDLNSSIQSDFIKAAASLDIPSGMLVYSWDNLSTKGGLHVIPDRVFVWNLRQRDEAMKLHRVPAERIVITGAPRFDRFLACRPRLARKVFCQPLGFDPRKPIVTYLCSSAFVSGNELPFVERWLRQLRSASSSLLRTCNVIVRPHPDIPLINLDVPATKPDWDLGEMAAVRRPFSDDAAVVLNTTSVTPQGLFECLWHSAVAVGLNTSAEIEAGLIGRPVLTVRAGEDADGQESTLHFHYLLEEHGGFVRIADSLEEHAAQLETTLTVLKRVGRKARRRAMSFVRPQGAEQPVADVLADAIEREFSRRPSMPVEQSVIA